MTIRTKLMIGMGMLLLVSAIIYAVCFRSLGMVQSNSERIVRVKLGSLAYLLEADRDLHQLLIAERALLSAEIGTPEFEKQVAAYLENKKQAEDRWIAYTELADSEDEKALFSKFVEARGIWEKVTAQVIEGCRNNPV
ncbi:MAG: MCP four helix bundle domain-containing protein, partial [Candidatus Delongbacteria bacterium]|nr:MCP four helix bundle domain-containing protein [Candidatus Delongbacteria bacterium]